MEQSQQKRPYFKAAQRQEMQAAILQMQSMAGNMKVPATLVAKGSIQDVRVFKADCDKLAEMAKHPPTKNWTGPRLKEHELAMRQLLQKTGQLH